MRQLAITLVLIALLSGCAPVPEGPPTPQPVRVSALQVTDKLSFPLDDEYMKAHILVVNNSDKPFAYPRLGSAGFNRFVLHGRMFRGKQPLDLGANREPPAPFKGSVFTLAPGESTVYTCSLWDYFIQTKTKPGLHTFQLTYEVDKREANFTEFGMTPVKWQGLVPVEFK